MNYEQKYNEILEWARKNKARLNGVPIEEVLPELAESEDWRIKNKSGYYKAGKFWKASTLWNAVKDKSPQRVPNRYILQECTWNISSLQHFADEVKNVQEVDLNYPIILDMNGNILDGAHRVVKAYLEGKDIDIVYLGDDEWPEPDYDEEKAVKESEDERIRKAIVGLIEELQRSDKYFAGVELTDMLAYLEKQKEQIPYTDFVIKPHKGDDNNPYDMGVSEAQEYAIKRGFGIPFNDGEVYIDERHMTQTIGNILRWADEHPKEQKPWKVGANAYFTPEQKPVKYGDDVVEEAEEYTSKVDCGEYGAEVTEAYIAGVLAERNRKPVEWSDTKELVFKDICNHLKEEGYSGWVLLLNALRNGEFQPKQEWSKEDEDTINLIIAILRENHPNGQFKTNPANTTCMSTISTDMLIKRIESLRPSWKPSEDEERLINTSISFLKDFADKGYENAVECIDWLKSKLNGNTGK